LDIKTYYVWSSTFDNPNYCSPADELTTIVDISSSFKIPVADARVRLMKSTIDSPVRMVDKQYEVWIEARQ